MAKLLKRLGSLALALIMVASLLPMNVFADEVAAEPAAVTVPEGFTGVGTPEELTAAVANGGKIALTADITLTSKLTVSKSTTFDWNGFTLTLTEKPTETNGTSTYSMYLSGGTNVFKDSSPAGDGGISITGAKNYVQGIRVGGGTLQIDSGKYYLQGSSGSSMFLFYTWRNTTINGGTFESVNDGSGSASAIYAANNSATAVTINGGSFSATCNTGSPYAINVASSTSTKYVNFPDSGKTVTVTAKSAGSVYGIYNGATMSIDNPKLTVNAESTYTGTANRYVYTLYNGRNINVTAGNFNGTETGSSTTVYVYGMSNGRITSTTDGVTTEVCQGYGTVSGGTFTATAPQRAYGINMNYADPAKGFTVTGNAVVTGSTAALQPWRGTVNITGGTYYANTPFSTGEEEHTLTVTGGKFKSADKRGMVEVKTYLDETYAQDSDGTVKLKTELTPWITVDGTGYYWVADGVAAIKADGTSVVKLNRDYIYRRSSAHVIKAAVAEFDLGGYTWHNCNTTGNALTFEPKDGSTNTHTYLKNGMVISDSNVAVRMSYGTFKMEGVTAQAYVGLGYYETDAATYDQTKNVVTNCVLLNSPTVDGYPFSFHLNKSTDSQQNVAVYFDNTVLVNVSSGGGAIFRVNTKYGFKGSVYLGENVHMYGGRNQWTSVQTAESGYTNSLSIYDHTGKKLSNGTFTASGCLGSNTWTYGDLTKLYLKVTTHGEELPIPAVPHTCTEDGLLAGSKCALCGAVVKAQVTDPAAHDNIVKVDGKAPTCVEAGWKDYYQCAICKEYFVDENTATPIGGETQLAGWKAGDGAIEATGKHTGEHTVAVSPDCVTDGNIEYWQCSVCNKYFKDAACTEEIVQAETVDPQWGHNFGTDGKCTNPGCNEEACKEGHTWGEKVAAQEANCAQGGWAAHYVCQKCGAYGTDAETPEVIAYEDLLIDIKPNVHTNLVPTPKLDATVYAPGYEAYWSCDGCHKLYADAEATDEISEIKVIPQLTAVAQIGETDKFATLQEAVDAAAQGDEIDLLTDIYLSASAKVAKDNVVTIDLNGHNVTVGYQANSTTNHIYWLENRGTLTLKDSVGTGSVASRGTYNYNELVIEKGTYSMLDTTGGAVVYQAKDTSLGVEPKLTVNGGSFTSAGYTFTIQAGTATFNKGTFVGSDRVVSNSGKVYIKGGTFHCSSQTKSLYTIYNNTGAYTEISGGTIRTGATTTTGSSGTNAYAVYNNADAEVKITGGTISAYVANTTSDAKASGLYNAGTATISGGTLRGDRRTSNGQGYGLRVEGSAVTTVSGGTISGVIGSAYINGSSSKNSKTTISGGNFTCLYLNANAQVYINGGTFDLADTGFAQILNGRESTLANYHITAGTFKTKDWNDKICPVILNDKNVEDYVTDKAVAIVNGTEAVVVADTVNKMLTGVNTFGKDGNAKAKLLQNVTDNDVNSFTTSFELNMNGKTWVQTSGSAVSVGTAGTAKQVTYIYDGYIYDKGSVAVSVSAGAMHLNNVDVYCTSAMPVAYYVRNGNYNAQNLIENSALVTNRFHAFSFRAENKAAEEDRQPGVGMTFRNTDLINIYKTTASDGNIFFAGEKLTTGTYTLGEGVNMYTVYSGPYNTADQESVVVTEEGVVIHDQLAAKQYPELTAILTPIGEAMGLKEGDIVYGSGTSAAIFTTNPTVYKWTTNHTNEYVSDNNGTCTENGTMTEKCTALVGGNACGVETGNTKTEEDSAKGHTYGEPSFTWADDNSAKATFTCSVCAEGTEGHTKEVDATITSETTPATCTEKGKTVYTATVDTYTDTKEVEIAATGHTLKGENQVDAECEKAGHKAYWYCESCKVYFSAEAATAEDVIENIDSWKAEGGAGYLKPLEHTYVEAEQNGWISNNDGTHYMTCDRNCGHKETKNCADYEVAFGEQAPTCTEPGYKAGSKCSVCEYVINATEVDPAKGHTEETVAGYAATCTESGLTEGKKCTVCGVTTVEQEIINALGHTEEIIPGKAATCTESGLTEGKKCTVCGVTTVEQETIDALGHTWVDGVHTMPTETANGFTTYTCKNNCGEKKIVPDVIDSEVNTDAVEIPEGSDPVTETQKDEIIDRVEKANDQIKIVVGFENQKNKDKIDEMKENNPELKEESPKLHIAAKKMFITGDKATKIVYDVTPMLGDQKIELDAEITFRLPVDAAVEKAYVYVFHEDECLGKYTVVGNAETGKYVVISSKTFSLYTVDAEYEEITEVSTLAELQAALAADNDLPILITQQIEIAAGENVTLDLNGKTVNAVMNGTSTTNHIYAISNKGDLTITDSKGNGSINSRGIYNYGELTLEAGTINAIDGNGGYAVNNESGSTFVMNGGTLAATYEDGDVPGVGTDATALDVPSGCTATLNGGKIVNVPNYTFAIMVGGELIVPEDSTVVVEGVHGAVCVSGGTATIDAGSFSMTGTAATTDSLIYVPSGTVTINGGSFDVSQTLSSSGRIIGAYDSGKATVNGGTFTSNGWFDFADSAVDNVTVNGATCVNCDDTVKAYVAANKSITLNGETYTNVVKEKIAEVDGVQYTDLQEAIDAADGKTVTLLTDVVLTEAITIESGKTVKLDLAGKTVSMEDASGKAACAVMNKGNLTIDDTVGDGMITFVSTTPSATNSYSTSTIINAGNLTVDGGTIKNTTTSGPSYAIDNAWYTQDVSLTVNDGTIKAAKIAVRQVPFSTTYKNVVNVNGGTLSGATAGLQLHNYASSATLAEVNIKGGTLKGTYPFYTYYSSASISAGTKIAIEGGTFDGSYVFLYNGNAGSSEYPMDITVTGGTFNCAYYAYCADAEDNAVDIPSIAGGTFTYAVDETLCKDGFVPTENADGTYGVTEATYVAQIGDTKYTTLQAAFDAAAASQAMTMITLIDDVELTATAVLKDKAQLADGSRNNVVLSTNNYKITGAVAPLIYTENVSLMLFNATLISTAESGAVIENAGALTVPFGTNKIEAVNDGCKAITSTGSLLIEVGDYYGAVEAEGYATIRGGVFYDTVDLADDIQATLGSGITIVGGTYHVKPEEADLADGYVINENADGTYGVTEATYVAQIGTQGYKTLAEAIAAAQAGETVKLLADVTAKDIIVIDKAITLDGNGKKLTSTAGRAINIDTTGKVVINDLTINAGERAINIINKASTVELNNVTATAKNNAVMIATSAGAAKLTINDSDLTGLAVVNVAGAGAEVAINNTNITNVDASSAEQYGAITVWSSADAAKVTVTGGSITVADDSREAYVFPGDATIEGVEDVGYIVATVGDAGFETLQAAINHAKAGNTVKLIRDVKASAIITIDKAITLDGNGKKLTSTAGRAINVDGADGATIKNLTIDAKGERAINVIGGATNVTIDNVTATAANYTVNVAGSAANAVVAIENSNLTGLNTVNVAAAGAKVTVDNTTVNCNDNNTTAGEVYAALCLNKDAVGAEIIATNTIVNVTEGSDSEKGRNGAEDGTVTINGSTEGVTVTVAVITYEGSDYYYGFTSIEAAIEFAKEGDTVTLIRDVTAKDIIVIDKAITLDGNGKKLTSTAGRAINVTGADGVTIKNLTIDAKGERAINVIGGATNVTVDNVTATAANYTVNVAASAANAVVAIENSDLTGLNTVNVAAAGADVTIDNTTITTVDNSAAEGYGAISMNKDAVNAKIVATNTTIHLTGSNASDSKIAKNGADGGEITINGTTEGVAVDVAYIATSGNYWNAFTTLEDAIASAKEGETVVLVRDIVLTEAITIANGKTVTIDLNGKTISGTDTTNKSYALITNMGDLTVKDSVGTGKITLTATQDTGYNRYSTVISNTVGGKLTVESGTIEHLGGHTMAYAIDNLTNGKGTYAETVINGGTVKSSYVGIRQFLNGVEADNILTVNGGTVTGNNTSIFFQDPSKNCNSGKLTVGSGATLGNRIYVSGTEGTDWDVEFSVSAQALGTYGITTDEIPATSMIKEVNGVYGIVKAAATVNGVGYETLEEALTAAQSGDTVTLLVDTTMQTAYDVKDMVLTIDGTAKLTFNDKLTVHGETTLNISCPTADQVLLGDGAILKDSTINGDVFVFGGVTFRGKNTVNMVYDFGTLTGNYGAEAPMAWTVEKGGSLTIVNKARYGFGYGDNVTIYGSLTDALTAREGLTEEDASLFTHGMVAQENTGWNCSNSMTVKDAYVIIGSNNSFGNKPGNYGGNYTFNFENVVLDGSRITFYEALSVTEFNFDGSDIKIGTFMTRDADSVFTLTDSVLLSTTTTNGTDEGNYNAGTLVLVNSKLTYSAPVVNTGVMQLDLSSSITAPTLTGTGKIVVDASNFNGTSVKLLNLDEATDMQIEIINNTDAKIEITADGVYVVACNYVAQIGNEKFESFAEALTAAQDGETIELLWAEGDAPIAMNGAVFGKTVTITGTATVDWSKGNLFIGRGGAGNGTVIFDNANLTSASNQASTGIHVSGREKDTTNKYDGTMIMRNSNIELDYLINKGTMNLDNSTLTVKNGFSIGGRPASETESGADATATLNLTNGSKVVVNNHNGMGLGYEAIGVMNVDATSTFETTQSFKVTAKGTLNLAGTATIAGTLENLGSIVLTDKAATLNSTECGNVTTNVEGYKVSYADGAYKLAECNYVAQIGEKKFESVAEAVAYAKTEGITDLVITLIGETTAATTDSFDLVYTTVFNSVTIKQEDATKTYYLLDLYTGARTNGGKLVFDGVNLTVTEQYMFEGNVELINNSKITSTAEANCFVYYANVTVQPGSKLKGVIDDIRGGTLIIDGGRTDGQYNTEADLRDAILVVNWADSELVLKNGAYVMVNSANEVGRVTVNGTVDISASKLDSYQWIAVNSGATMKLDLNSEVVTKQITGAGTITIDASAFTGETQVIKADMSGFTGTVEVTGNDMLTYEVKADGLYVVEKALFQNTTTGATYTDLQTAINEAAAGETIQVLENVELTDTVTVAAGKTVTLDLNGKTISQTKECTASYEMIANNGSLTIKDSATGGKISFTDTSAGDAAAKWGVYTIRNSGTLVVESGTIENLSAQNQAGQPFAHTTLAIFQYSGSTTINGGVISTPNYRSVRLWSGDLTINGGVLDGQVWVQCVNDTAKLTITGGEFSPNWNDASSVFVNNSGKAAELNITGGSFATKIGADSPATLNGLKIAGGTFTAAAAQKTNAALLGNGFAFAENADGSYGITAVLPEVEITEIKDSLPDSDPDLTFALNFKIKDMENLTDEYLEALFNVYGSHYVDYVLTIEGLSDADVTFNANGGADGYLAGQYDAYGANWVSVPFEDVTMTNGESLYIMEYAAKLMGKQGLRFTLAEVAEIVQDFDCGVYFTPEFLKANPNLKVTLELKVFTEDAEGNKIEDVSVATNVFENEYEAIVVATNKQTHYFTTLEEAVAAAQAGETVILLADATIDETVKIEKAITVDLFGNAVTTTAKKAFEVYADATIMNGTIEAANRAVDTRTAVALTLTDVNLIADEYTAAYGNPQPLTIGGSTNGTKVTVNNVTIDAGTAGYGIITFVETELTATDSTVSGYSALYVKPGSENSKFTFVNTDLSGSTANNDVAGNSFTTIAVRADNVTVTADADSTITATGNHCAAISLGGTAAGEEEVNGAIVTVAGTINGNVLAQAALNDNKVTVPAAYGDELVAAGYSYFSNADGSITATEKVDLPEVEITEIKDSLADSDPDQTFALNFKIKDMENLTDEYLEALFNVYGSHYVDYVLTIEGLSDADVTFNANGGADGYLAGQYDAYGANWVSVPFEDVTMTNGESLYIMEYAAKLMGKQGLRFTLAEVAEIVQDFDCGVYFTPEFLKANPNLKVTLELKVFTEDAEGNKIEDVSVATNVFENEYEAIVVATNKQTHYFTTLEEAVAAAQAGETVILLADATIDETVKIEKAITVDLFGNAVTTTAKKAFEVYADATIMNGTIEAANRAVDTRTAVALTLTDVNLIADEYTAAYGNPQPLTIGGSTNGTKVTVNNVTIDAGTAGYGIITFVETELTATDSTVSGYSALYVKPGSENSKFTFVNTDLSGKGIEGETNDFATIVVQANDVTVTTTGGKIAATGTQQWLIGVNDGYSGATFVLDSELDYADAGIVGAELEGNAISVREAYVNQITAEGFMHETSAMVGLIDLTQKAVASVNGTLYDDLRDAIDEAEELGTATVIVLDNVNLTSHIVVSEGITLDLNGYAVTTTKTFTVYGDVIDGTAGGEGYISASKVHIAGERSYLPIYDTAVGGYRFYDYQLINLGGRSAGENAVKFGIRLVLTNTDGYAVLANTTDAKLSLHALVTWDSLGTDIDYVFQTATVKSYAEQVAAQVASGATITKAITLTVTGLDKLPEGETLKLTPQLESETEMTTTGATAEWATANS